MKVQDKREIDRHTPRQRKRERIYKEAEREKIKRQTCI